MWNEVFEREWEKRPGAKQEEMDAFLQTWNDSLSVEELQEIRERQKNPFPKSSPFHDKYIPLDPSSWAFPKYTLPNSYVKLLAYSNGGEFQNGDRYFQFFGTHDFREMDPGLRIRRIHAGLDFLCDGW